MDAGIRLGTLLFLVCLVNLEVTLASTGQTCSDALGLESGAILSSQLTAGKLLEESNVDSVRYNCCQDEPDGGLCLDPPSSTTKPYLDVRFPNLTAVTAITLQAPANNGTSYVRWYRVQFKVYNEKGLQDVMEGTEQKDFRGIKTAGETEYKSPMTRTPVVGSSTLVHHVVTQHLRIILDDYSNNPCFRLELFGCESSQLCQPGCENGGVCVDEGTCDCLDGFTGDRCQDKKLVIDPAICKLPLGMSSGDIADSQLSAKSTASTSSLLNARPDAETLEWCPNPEAKSVGQWYQVEFPQPMGITKIMIEKLADGCSKYLRTYSVQYVPEDNFGSLLDYTQNDEKVIYHASNSNESSTSDLPVPIYTRKIRLVVESYEKQPCFKFELYGCDPNKKDAYITTALTPELETRHFKFVLSGSPIPQFVPTSNSSKALELSGNQYVLLEPRDQNFQPCTCNIALCDKGLTVQVRVLFKEIYDNTYLFSNGGYSSDTEGLTILYRFGMIHSFVRIKNKFWFVSFKPKTTKETWAKIHVSWHMDKGLKMYLNNALVVENKEFQHENNEKPEQSECFIGGLPDLKAPYAESLIENFVIWTTHVSELLEDEQVVLDGKILKPETCPAGCVKEGSTITGYPVLQGEPTLVDTTDDSGRFMFICNLPPVAEKNVEYRVSWISEGEVVASSIATGKESRLTLEGELKSRIGSTVMCTVRARFTGGCGGKFGPEKKSYYFTARVELLTPSLTLVEGGKSGRVELKSNAPPSMICSGAQFTISAILERHRRELRDRNRQIISQAVLEHVENVTSSSVVVTEKSWSDLHFFLVKAVLDGRADRDQVRDLTVILTCKNGAKRILGQVKLRIIDSDSPGSCASWNDPHIRTFNRKVYDNFYAGEFIFYRHKEQPYQINTVFSACSRRSRATCNCAVAIRTQDDVIIFNKCNRRRSRRRRWRVPLEIYLISNGEWTEGTQVRRVGCGNKHVVTLPHGGEVTVRNSWNFLNVNYKPGPSDYSETEGLCGTYDQDRYNDLMLRNGTIISKYSRHQPNVFNEDWRARKEESLFQGVMPSAVKFVYGTYCRVLEGERTSCGVGYDRIVSPYAKQGRDVTQMYVKDFSYKSRYTKDVRRGDAGRRSKRATDEPANFDPFAPIDMDEDHDPTNQNGTWSEGMTEEEARKYCSDEINNDKGVQICTRVLSRSFDAEIDACVQDIQATGDTVWASESIAAIIAECRTVADSADSSAEDGGEPAPLAGGVVMDQLESSICPGDCNGNGICNQGKCECKAGFVGDACLQKLSDPPQLHYLHEDGLCDKKTRECRDAVVFGDNFFETNELTCHLQPYKLGTKILNSNSSTAVKVAAVFTKFDQIACPINLNGPHLVRVSNDGIHPTNEERLFMAYNSICEECTMGETFADAVCIRMPNSCIIDGECYAKGDKNVGDHCQVCDPRNTDSQWTPSYLGECRYLSRALSTTDLTIIILVTVFVLTVLILTIIYHNYKKCARKDPEPLVPPVVHKSTRYKNNDYTNETFNSEFDSHVL